jgi:DNA polymerase IV (DinB-like DNA polymerase)
MRIIAHIDMDAFYAAVEERHHPELRGRPVVVGADPKAGKGRGVVTTANYAARKYGIRSALPISRAWRLADVARKRGEAETVFVRGNQSLYREVSDRIMAILARGADAFEGASIDEVYVDLTSLGDMKGAEGHVRRLKAKILAQEGLTCSVGIGPNKLVAKIASDFRKPDGLTVVRPEAVQAFLDPLRSRVIPGIGPKTEAFLHRKGIKTIADLRGVEIPSSRRGSASGAGACGGRPGDCPKIPSPTSGSGSPWANRRRSRKTRSMPALSWSGRACSPARCIGGSSPRGSRRSGP